MILNKTTMQSITDAATPEFVNYLIQTRRRLHEYPELSFQEVQTSSFIRAQLDELAIPYRIAATTGTIATIGSGTKCVGLRADIDALPITEETNLPFASQNPGVMHACGHDTHTAMLLGAARLLKENESQLGGTVVLVFQPGEEKSPGGASLLIAEGALDSPRPQAMFGQHIDPDQESGVISFVSGPMMASADELTISIHGFGAHAAQPHKGHDPLFTAAGLVQHLQGVLSRMKNPLVPSVLTITSFHGGTTFNVIPESVVLQGTLRSFDSAWREEAWKVITEQVRDYCALFQCTSHVEITKGYPPLVNNAHATAFARSVAEEVFGDGYVREFEPKMWAEDFSYYAEIIPSCFWMLGGRPSNSTVSAGLHHPRFSPDESAMIKGAQMLAAVAMRYLATD